MSISACGWEPKREKLSSTPLHQFDPMVSVATDPFFPYLDMELFWDEEDSLKFRVHLKPNQQLKYLNSDSTHNKACFKAMPTGVATRLAKLTSLHPSNRDTPLDALYPHHFQKLQLAGLIKTNILTLSQEFNKYLDANTDQSRTNKQLRQRDRARTIYFCVGHSRAWTTPIHKIIKEAKAALNLTWLRVPMSYHRFPNLREYFQRDLHTKLISGIQSLDFENLPCNCRKENSQDTCKYNNMCRHSLIVYKVECKNTGKIYIGNTQEHASEDLWG
jgi:hypothetical protein